jgi:hypothetical protein
MNDYLPKGTASTLSLNKMEEEYGSDIPNARVMISGVTIPEALEVKEKLEKIDGVTFVTWLDDAADITVPLEMMDKDIVESYYKDNAALFSVTVAENKRMDAVNAIRKLIGDDNAMTGSAVNMAYATQSTTKEILKITMIAGFVLGLIMLIFAAQLSSIYSDDPMVISESVGVVRMFGVVELAVAILNICSSTLKAAGDIKYVMVTSFIGLWSFRVLASFGLNMLLGMGMTAVMIGVFLDFTARSAMYMVRMNKGKWKYLRV